MNSSHVVSCLGGAILPVARAFHKSLGERTEVPTTPNSKIERAVVTPSFMRIYYDTDLLYVLCCAGKQVHRLPRGRFEAPAATRPSTPLAHGVAHVSCCVHLFDACCMHLFDGCVFVFI